MGLIGLIMTVISLILMIIWNELKYERLRNEVDTLKEKTTEILKAYYEEIDYLKDTLTEIREKTRE